MLSKSRKQLKYIFAMRKKYKAKANAPESKQLVFNDEWQKEIDPKSVTSLKDFKTFDD